MFDFTPIATLPLATRSGAGRAQSPEILALHTALLTLPVGQPQTIHVANVRVFINRLRTAATTLHLGIKIRCDIPMTNGKYPDTEGNVALEIHTPKVGTDEAPKGIATPKRKK